MKIENKNTNCSHIGDIETHYSYGKPKLNAVKIQNPAYALTGDDSTKDQNVQYPPAYALKSDDGKNQKPISAYALKSDDGKTKNQYPAYALKSDDGKNQNQCPDYAVKSDDVKNRES